MKNFTETAKNVLHNTLMCLGCIAEMLRIKLFLSKDEKVVYALCNTVQEFLEESYSHLGYVKCSDEEVNQILYDYLNHYTSRKYGIKFLIPANQLREYDPRFKGKHFKGQQAIRIWDELNDFYQEYHYHWLVKQSNLCDSQKANRSKLWNAAEVIHTFLDYAQPEGYDEFYYARN